jgi:hypothetical protein
MRWSHGQGKRRIEKKNQLEKNQMKVKNLFVMTLVAAMFAAVLAVSALAQGSQTVIVLGNTTTTENTPGGWMFNRDPSNATPIAFTNTKADIGYGSLNVLPIGADPLAKFIGENFVRTNIANVNSISFDFLMGAGATDPQQFYMNVYTNFAESSQTKFYDCRYDVLATVGSNATWTTVSFDPTQNYPVATRNTSPHACPASPSLMDNFGAGSHLRAIAITLGDSSSSDLGYDGYFDKVVVNTTAGTTTYDFEPYLVPTNANQCKNGGWQTYRRADGTTFRNQGDCIQYVNNGH